MYTIVSKPPTISIYCCEYGGIHLVYQNVNIGMHPNEFCALNQNVQQAMRRIADGTWPCPYASLTYNTTVVCLALTDLEPLAEAMAEAAAAVATILDLDLDDLACPPQAPGLSQCVAPQQGKQLDTIDNNHLSPN